MRSVKLGHAKSAKPTIFVEAAGRPGRIRAPLRGERVQRINRFRAAGLALILAAAAATGVACGERSRAGGHGRASTTPEPAPPTPDTTPIEALRTPAGLVLKIDQPTPVPSVTPTPTP